MLDAVLESALLLYAGVFILGALIGSFLNVVIYRLPIMMERDWREQCQEMLEHPPERKIPEEIYELFPVLYKMLKRRGGDLSGGQQQQLAIGRALVTKPKLLILDEPTEGIQPSIIKDIQKVISLLRDRGEMAILLVEQYFDFARELADNYAVMDRGEVVLSGLGKEMEEETVRRYIAV